MKENIVYVAKSLDGFIAGPNGELDWLDRKPDQGVDSDINEDMGYGELMNRIDAILMGRITFEFVRDYDGPWPYSKHVYVLSTSLQSVPNELEDKVTLLSGGVDDVLKSIHSNGHESLYIDGGKVIHDFMKADMVDEMILTTVPIVLGSGIPLFRDLTSRLQFKHVRSGVYFEYYTQDTYLRIRD